MNERFQALDYGDYVIVEPVPADCPIVPRDGIRIPGRGGVDDSWRHMLDRIADSLDDVTTYNDLRAFADRLTRLGASIREHADWHSAFDVEMTERAHVSRWFLTRNRLPVPITHHSDGPNP